MNASPSGKNNNSNDKEPVSPHGSKDNKEPESPRSVIEGLTIIHNKGPESPQKSIGGLKRTTRVGGPCGSKTIFFCFLLSIPIFSQFKQKWPTGSLCFSSISTTHISNGIGVDENGSSVSRTGRNADGFLTNAGTYNVDLVQIAENGTILTLPRRVSENILDQYFNTTTTTTTTNVSSSSSGKSTRPCRVLIENRPDYHYELLESTILRYPLPWENFNCSIEEPILFDLMLAETGWFSDELDGWKEYYDTYLKHTVRSRFDNTEALIGNVLNHTEYEKRYQYYQELYDAVIGVSCGTRPPAAFLDSHPNHFCVLHVDCVLDKSCNVEHRDRYCYLNPMHDDDDCFFSPIDFPQFPFSKCKDYVAAIKNHQTKIDINVCVVGGAKEHHLLAEALKQMKPTDVKISILGRDENIPNPYKAAGLTDMINIVREKNFVNFQRSISRCDLLLPLNKFPGGYFHRRYDGGVGKQSGSMAHAMGYKLPTVMHLHAHEYYGPYLTAPSLVYQNSTEFVETLDRMLRMLRTTIPVQRERSCANYNDM